MTFLASYPSEAVEATIYPRVGMYIDGEWIYDRDPFALVRNPSTGNVLGPVPRATDADLARALSSSEKGFARWRDTPPQQRVDIILKATALLRERTAAIAKILSLENGKSLAHATGEIRRCYSFYEWDAGQSLRTYGYVVPSEPRLQKLVLRQPIGPVVAFTPWNVPMSSAARKTSGALSAGCSIILKAATETPATACELVRCFEEAGLPPGVLNLVFGDPGHISSTLIGSPISRLVTFTGSTHVGKHLTELAARAMKPVLMELGGNAPVIVCDNVNAAEIGRMAAEAKSRASGQICASASRFIVHKNVYSEFVDAFAEAASRIKVGDPFIEGIEMGPLANERRLTATQAMVDDAISRGARIAAGGKRLGERGFFFAPTVIADVPLDADALTQEPFGPIGACVAVPDLDTAIALANSVSVGLASYVFTNSLQESEEIARRIEAGVVSINHFDTPYGDTPFGGIKESGVGREGGPQSLEPYLVSKTVLQYTARV